MLEKTAFNVLKENIFFFIILYNITVKPQNVKKSIVCKRITMKD